MGLKLINHPVRAEVPIVIASLGPRNVELTAEIADGWMPTLYSPSQGPAAFAPSLDAGRARRSPDLGPLTVYGNAAVAVTDRPEMARAVVRQMLALYLGGMGSREENFYNRLVQRYGYVDEARTVQDLYLSGKRDEAAAAVPDALIDDLAAIGDAAAVKDKLAQYAAAGVDVLMVSLLAFDQPGRMALLERLPSLV